MATSLLAKHSSGGRSPGVVWGSRVVFGSGGLPAWLYSQRNSEGAARSLLNFLIEVEGAEHDSMQRLNMVLRLGRVKYQAP